MLSCASSSVIENDPVSFYVMLRGFMRLVFMFFFSFIHILG
jgi:hypothetical protein